MIAAMARRISSPIIVGRTEELEALLAAVGAGCRRGHRDGGAPR